MDVFQGNQKLEEVIFTGLDYALYSRYDLHDAFTPFMMLHKNGVSKLLRVVAQGDPMSAFAKALQQENEQYDQVVMCVEARVPHNGEKQDAIVVKGFDTSQPQGLMFIQRFRGKESGHSFQKLGNPALVSTQEELPVPLVARNSNKSVEATFLSQIVKKETSGETSREIFAGHDNPSFLASRLFDTVLNILDKNEPEFSGQLNFNFVPDTMELGGFTTFIFEQLVQDLKSNPAVQNWELAHQKKLSIQLKFNKGETSAGSTSNPVTPETPTETTPATSKYASFSVEELHQEFYRLVSIPNARTNIEALSAMAELIEEYERRGIEMPKPGSRPAEPKKPWWKIW